MVTDEDVLEKEDMYILDKIKEFASTPEVANSIAAAKQLVVLIERVVSDLCVLLRYHLTFCQQRGGDGPFKTTSTASMTPPAPILPKASKKLKLIDVDTLELARQLTLMESSMYKKIRPIECLQRSREQKTGSKDNISSNIQLSNRVRRELLCVYTAADWLLDRVLGGGLRSQQRGFA